MPETSAQHKRYTPQRSQAITDYIQSLPKGMGKTQCGVLKHLLEFGSWSLGCGWRWDTPLETKRHLERLVKRGLAIRTEGKQEYWPIVQFDEEGRQVNADHNPTSRVA